jgi:hypothetical protein
MEKGVCATLTRIVRGGVAVGMAVGLGAPASFGASAMAAAPQHEAAPAVARAPVGEAYAKLPMAFEPNVGQTDARMQYLTRGRGYALFLTGQEAVLALHREAPPAPAAGPDATPDPGPQRLPHEVREPGAAAPERGVQGAALRMRLVGAAPDARLVGADQLEGKVNYLRGRDASQWKRDIPTYAAVRQAGVYAGVDAVYSGKPGQLECRFVVAAGVDPGAIELEVDGADRLRVSEDGDLVVTVDGQELRQRRPLITSAGDAASKRAVVGAYELAGANRVRVAVEAGMSERAMTVEMTLDYSTYLGPAYGAGIAVDASGAAYVTGYAYGADFPTMPGAFDTSFNGSNDAFVTKMNPAGSGLVYSTYLGGSGADAGAGIAVDASGAAYVTGLTYSADFPTTAGAFDTSFNGGTICDQFGCITFRDAYVTKLNASGSGLVYSTFLGGASDDQGTGIAVDASGAAYVTGNTLSGDFPTAASPAQPSIAGAIDAFVVRLNLDGAAPDTTPPTCVLTASHPGPPASIEVTNQDTGSGLASIQVLQATNCTVTVPSFAAGTTAPVIVVATKLNQARQAVVRLRVTDVAGNVTIGDPVVTTLAIPAGGTAVRQQLSGLAPEEGLITVQNGTPGLERLRVAVNGLWAEDVRLAAGETRTLDVRARLAQGRNRLTLKGTGPGGGKAEVVIADGVTEPAGKVASRWVW